MDNKPQFEIRFVQNAFGRVGPMLFLNGERIPEQLDTRIEFPVGELPTFTVSFYLGGKTVGLAEDIPRERALDLTDVDIPPPKLLKT